MKEIFIKSARKIIQNKKELEDKLGVKLSVKGTSVTLSGDEAEEYFAERVLIAMDFPFLVEDALLLKREDFMFDVLSIKEFTRRHDFETIKGRIIGTKGKTLKVLEDLSDCIFALRDNSVAIIGPSESIELARQAVISLIKGSKQGNVYSYLERNRKRKKEHSKNID
jgi:ribosomal RNA assembly protein